MNVVVHGGNGVVMAATVRRLLQARATTRVTVFDRWQQAELVSERLWEFAERVAFLSGFEWRVEDETPEFDLDLTERLARFNADSIARIQPETGWAPRSLRDEVHAYITWVHEAPEKRWPPADGGSLPATSTEGALTHGI